ncbi:hypothetical protein NL108_012019 [Boleophthalmus pectinirostris]|nr:hypothetical protein NL108_012019 [Boleophthalmus pectinirostris]
MRQFLDLSSASVIAGRNLQESPQFGFTPFLLLFFFQRPQKPTFFCGELVVDSRPPSTNFVRIARKLQFEKDSKNRCINHVIPTRQQVSYTRNIGSLIDNPTANRK